MEWFYPASIEEAVEFVSKGVIPHAGGTGILRSNPDRISEIVELSGIGLNSFLETDSEYIIGSMLTFSNLVEKIKIVDKQHLLIQSLSKAASTLLRNRITIGGSVFLSPIWSDLMGPLLILDSQLRVAGTEERIFYKDFLANRKLLQNRLIESVIIPRKSVHSTYYREVRTSFDYPAFTISIISNSPKDSSSIVSREDFTSLRIIVTGCKSLYCEMTETVREIMKDRNFINSPSFHLKDRVEFVGKRHGSNDYLKEVLTVQLRRLLQNFRSADEKEF
ncbi:MAG: FAD binding domain-containing protein [Candidatus Cloacimonetes bacterium]|nr:FAD binding domain-containing protein [Candidatus Cloacimonadota bacterium]